MHSVIIQIYNAPIKEHQSLYSVEDAKVDYLGEKSVAFRRKTINELIELVGNGILSRPNAKVELPAEDKAVRQTVLVYNGGIEPLIDQWKEDVKAVMNDNINDFSKSSKRYQIFKALDNPLDTDILFSISNYNEYGELDRSEALISLLSDMKAGDYLYVGAIFDYHI
ncbi:MAG: hypothetical protein LIP09_12335 [Bacteroidales bacterium]|nr:hypothetical protein [Bacteroidales bacterium]